MLYIGSDEVNSYFRLMGKNEDALTFGLAYAFSRHLDFLIECLKNFDVLKKKQGKIYKDFLCCNIILQDQKDKSLGGRKDIIIETLNKEYRIVIEAKIGNNIPTIEQLQKYSLTQQNNKIEFDYIQKEWGAYKNKFLVTLTRKLISEDCYIDLIDKLASENIDISIVNCYWFQVINSLKNFNYIIIKELKTL